MAYKKLKYWFDRELAEDLSKKILLVDESFEAETFILRVEKDLDLLELKPRVEKIADELFAAFSKYFSKIHPGNTFQYQQACNSKRVQGFVS